LLWLPAVKNLLLLQLLHPLQLLLLLLLLMQHPLRLRLLPPHLLQLPLMQ
jgi:hypothetical protein